MKVRRGPVSVLGDWHPVKYDAVMRGPEGRPSGHHLVMERQGEVALDWLDRFLRWMRVDNEWAKFV